MLDEAPQESMQLSEIKSRRNAAFGEVIKDRLRVESVGCPNGEEQQNDSMIMIGLFTVKTNGPNGKCAKPLAGEPLVIGQKQFRESCVAVGRRAYYEQREYLE